MKFCSLVFACSSNWLIELLSSRELSYEEILLVGVQLEQLFVTYGWVLQRFLFRLFKDESDFCLAARVFLLWCWTTMIGSSFSSKFSGSVSSSSKLRSLTKTRCYMTFYIYCLLLLVLFTLVLFSRMSLYVSLGSCSGLDIAAFLAELVRGVRLCFEVRAFVWGSSFAFGWV